MEKGVIQDVRLDKQAVIPILQRLSYGTTVYLYQTLGRVVQWYRDWYAPAKFPPNAVKRYQCRPSLPIRIFYPKSYDPNTQALLPTLFSVHGGGFCLGRPNDDDKWNTNFANMHDVLVIALNYRKAPTYPFPTATYDLEALMLAAFDDESLPIDKNRTALSGFSAGGSLILSVCQLPSIREKVKPKAAIPIYAIVDKSIPMEIKLQTRHYKPDLGFGTLRAKTTDFLKQTAPVFFWSYINPGTNLKDPLLSPYFAPRDTLPPHLFFISSELDQLVHESWCMASKLAGRPEPSFSDRAGQEKRSAPDGEFVFDDERFAFDERSEDGKSSVRWLIVPDQIHGFDKLPPHWMGESAVEDAKVKETAYQKFMGEWLHEVVWK